MGELRYTLVADGTSDRRLIPALTWLLQHHSSRSITPTWADFTVIRPLPRTLAEKIKAAIEYYPSDLLFIHRDAEGEPRQQRLAEIELARQPLQAPPIVPVIPVRMQEAWLLIDEQAIRAAAGRPRGREHLNLPPRASLEAQPDPKALLYNALANASELSGRHLRRFKVAAAAYRVAELIEDYSLLRGLPSFDALELDVTATLRMHGLT